MFVETSAIVDVLLEKPEAVRMAGLITASGHPFTTPLTVFEAALVIGTRRRYPVVETMADILELLDAWKVTIRPLELSDAIGAADAADRFGKGRGHPAQLNLCDCLAYGAARRADGRIAFVGSDFSKTDRVID